MSDFLKAFWAEEDGLQTVEIVLIIIVIAAIAFLFRGWIMGLLETIFRTAEGAVDQIQF